MRANLAAALFLACAAAVAAIPTQYCDPDYQCQWTYIDSTGAPWVYDLSNLCSGTDYQATDSQNHTYFFNICGLSHYRCLPTWQDTYQYGVAVQTWGPEPPCNATTPKCYDPHSGNYTCCSANCEVLGIGIPIYKLMVPGNPLFGGLQITYRGVPPPEQDSYKCPIDPKTHQMEERTVTFNITCDETVAPNTVTVQGAYQDPANPCSYTIVMAAQAVCGCSPDCEEKNCGPDGCGGFCGGLSGGCPNPSQYTCQANQICCKPDCTFRDCGPDGCGGFCGNCSANAICNRVQQCSQVILPSPSNIRSASPGQTPAPLPTPYRVTQYKTAQSTIVGAFFGGLIATAVVGGVVIFLSSRRSGSVGAASYTQSLGQ